MIWQKQEKKNESKKKKKKIIDILRPFNPQDAALAAHQSLRSYVHSTYALLRNGASALDAVVHAVSLMEDDPLFDAGRGSVFTSEGTIEMEASIMLTSLRDDWRATGDNGPIKRGAGVMLLNNVRHPIKLAREALLRAGVDVDGKRNNDGGNLHTQIAGPYAEQLAREWDVELKPDDWFRTDHRWEEYQKNKGAAIREFAKTQGTVGCVCLDQWGDIVSGTSTGGLANKLPGRVGDTPVLGAGTWAETWEDSRASAESASDISTRTRRAVGISCTGNGDTFLRVNASRTAAAMVRFGNADLGEALTAVAGPGGELQSCAGNRWQITGEGRGGMIGIEAEVPIQGLRRVDELGKGKLVYDFNGPSLWRGWIETGDNDQVEAKVMVFRDEF
ncbi:hypothetical protein FALBO_1744 [Fusarium albosuccineum]|uniref:Asparaginase n=1 Tax=Fusarium albosuccineum TaxID=1237068 RepID=A0A8H4LLD7_9HYPO|nr:hypothetical protein FALBO_1744 [Fusarium albosuccineum]